MLTIQEVAERYRVGRETVVTWIEQGELPAVNVGPAGSRRKFWRIGEAELQAFALRRQSGTTRTATTIGKSERIREFV